jgi:hypothetical protein
MLELQLGLGAQPVVVVVTAQIGVDIGLRPGRESLGQLLLGRLDTVALRDLAMAARKQRLGGVVEGAEQRALPTGPDARTHRANVAGGEDHQQR